MQSPRGAIRGGVTSKPTHVAVDKSQVLTDCWPETSISSLLPAPLQGANTATCFLQSEDWGSWGMGEGKTRASKDIRVKEGKQEGNQSLFVTLSWK